MQHISPVLKMEHSEDARIHPPRYTSSSDSGTRFENTRLRSRASRVSGTYTREVPQTVRWQPQAVSIWKWDS